MNTLTDYYPVRREQGLQSLDVAVVGAQVEGLLAAAALAQLDFLTVKVTKRHYHPPPPFLLVWQPVWTVLLQFLIRQTRKNILEQCWPGCPRFYVASVCGPQVFEDSTEHGTDAGSMVSFRSHVQDNC